MADIRGKNYSIEKLNTSFSQNASLHGMIWYNRIENRILKNIIYFMIFFFIIFVGSFVVSATVDFFRSRSEKNAVEWVQNRRLLYPNITACAPNFFLKENMETYNISEELGNYMTLSVKHNAKEIFKYRPEYLDNLTRLELELDRVLDKSGMNLLELMRKLAPSCQKIVVYCQIHGNPEFAEKCCTQYFHAYPNFSPFGSCYTSKLKVWESTPLTYSSYKIWFYMPDDIFMNPISWIIGANEVVRGLTYTVSQQDLPMRSLDTMHFHASLGSHSIIGLNKEDIDRSQVGDCQQPNDQYFEKFGMKNTLINCQIRAEEDFNRPNCSMQAYYGLSDEGKPPCLPKDTLSLSNLSPNETKHCLVQCVNILLKPYITTSNSSAQAIENYIRYRNLKNLNKTKPENYVGLSFFYQNLGYSVNVVSVDGLAELFSKVGGWLGLILGASVVSIIEICIYGIYIFYALIFNKIKPLLI